MKQKITLLLIIALLSGCASLKNKNAFTSEDQFTSIAKGCLLGLIGGAGSGAGIGAAAGDPGIGAAIGAVAGLATGCGAGYYFDVQEDELRKRLKGTGVSVERKGNNIRLIMPSNVLFKSDSANINSKIFPVLNSVIVVLKEFDDDRLTVSGFTDSQGSFEHNQLLSEQRALSVFRYLTQNGISKKRIRVFGLSERHPIADNSTILGRAQNRRVELTIDQN